MACLPWSGEGGSDEIRVMGRGMVTDIVGMGTNAAGTVGDGDKLLLPCSCLPLILRGTIDCSTRVCLPL